MRTNVHQLCTLLISGDTDDQNFQVTSHEARPVSSSIQQHQRVFNSSSHGARVMRSLHMPQVKWSNAKCKVALWIICLYKITCGKTPTSVYEKTALLTWGQGWSHWTLTAPPKISTIVEEQPPVASALTLNSATWKPAYNGNLSEMETCLKWEPLWNENLLMKTSTDW